MVIHCRYGRVSSATGSKRQVSDERLTNIYLLKTKSSLKWKCKKYAQKTEDVLEERLTVYILFNGR